jgi:hypothetical protein
MILSPKNAPLGPAEPHEKKAINNTFHDYGQHSTLRLGWWTTPA